MATYDDILNGGGTPSPKGSKEWHEQQQDGSSASPPVKGTQEWAEQKAATAPVASAPQIPASQKNMPPTNGGTSGENVQASSPVEIKTGQQVPVNHGKVVREFGDGIHAFMEDGTIRTSGFAGYTYSTPENVSNVDLFKILNPYTPPTDEELAKEKKKQKRDQIFAAIGDGISALSNLFFTTKYAPNMYDGKNSMSERTRVRYDRLMKEREGKEKEYYAGLMKAKIADEEKADRDRKWQRQLGLDNYNRIRNDAKEERDRQMFELNLQLQGNKISASEAEAKRKGIEAKYAEELEKARLETEKAKAKYYNRGGSGGMGGSYSIYNPNTGKTEYFKNQGERDRRAGELGYDMSPGSSSSESSDNLMGNKKTTSQKGASASARLGQQEAEKKRKANGKKTGLGLGNGENNSSGKKTGLGL